LPRHKSFPNQQSEIREFTIIKRCCIPALLKTTPDNNNALYALFLRNVAVQVNRLLCWLAVSAVITEVVANSWRDKWRESQALK
jgi:hypothetical protein